MRNGFQPMSRAARLMTQSTQLIFLLVVALTLYLLTMPRLITLEDAGLFQMVCHLDGISHPPGYPLFTMLCNAMTVAPHVMVGNFVSVVFALGAVLIFFKVVLLITRVEFTALLAAAAYSLSATFWSQAIIIEVYSLAALLFMACWWLSLKFIQTLEVRYWFALSLVAGLAISNHWPLFILSCLGLLSLGYGVRIRIWALMHHIGFWLGTLGLFILGLSPYLSLLINQNPEIAVFGPVSSDELLSYVTRSYYDDSRAGAVFGDKLQYLLWLVPESLLQFGLVAAPIIIIGLYRSFIQLKLELAISLLMIFLSTTFLLILMLDFKFDIASQSVFRPYALIAYSSLAIWLAIGLSWLLELSPKFDGRLKWLSMVLIVVSVAVYNFPKIDRSNSIVVDEYARIILESLPKNAILLLEGDNEVGPIGFLNKVSGVRPDVTLFERGSLVFSNRISDPLGSREEVEQATRAFVKDQVRPVFSIKGDHDISTSYGLYYSYNNINQNKYEFLPEFEIYLDYVIDLYENDMPVDLHEKQFIYDLLISLSRHYARYGLEAGMAGLAPERLARIQRLQSTFPGKLAMIEAIFFIGAEVENEKLLQLAIATEQQIDDQKPNMDVGVFYRYFGLIKLKLDDDEGAIRMFEKSLSIMPAEDNKSICALKSLYRQRGDDLRFDLLAQEYSSREC